MVRPQAREGCRVIRRTYHVVRTLGYGGFGTVYHAKVEGEGGFTKDVALKIINPEAVSQLDVAQRMRDEARVLGLVRHRAIVHVDGLSKLAGRWTVIMELVEGADLRSLLKRGPVPPGPALEITREVASALHAAFNTAGLTGPLKLLHRDIKPSNIQLTPLGEVKVLDFGIARADFEEREAATQGILYGTPDYMAPERFAFEESHGADIYALGATLYEMLAGRPLGRTSPLPERHAKHMAEAMDRLTETLPEANDPELLDFIREMLALEAEERPTARDVERRCSQILPRFGTLSLRDWAEEALPPVMEARRGFPLDPLLGTTLSEQTEAENLTWAVGPDGNRESSSGALPTLPMTPTKSLTRTGGRPWRLGLGLVVVAVLSGGVTLGFLLWGWEPPAVAVQGNQSSPTRMPIVAAVTHPQPPTTVTAPPVEDPSNDPPERLVVPKPISPATSAAPDPSPATSATEAQAQVSVQGDARRVWLVSGTVRYPVPGDVPPGSYVVEAEFPTRGLTHAGTLRVAAHAALSLTCKDAFGRCSTP